MRDENFCQLIVDEYIEWLKSNITISHIGSVCEMTLPFLDRHNDYLQIYIHYEDGKFTFSDDRYIINDLRMSGFEISEKRQEILDIILNGFDVKCIGGEELRIITDRENIAQANHRLIQAMLAINDLFVMAQPRVAHLFKDDVEMFLKKNDVKFVTSYPVEGRTGYEHTFDFFIPESEVKPQRFVRAINRPSKDSISSYTFMWADILENRPSQSRAYAVLNDENSEVSEDTYRALRSYDIVPMLWTKRNQYIDELAA